MYESHGFVLGSIVVEEIALNQITVLVGNWWFLFTFPPLLLFGSSLLFELLHVFRVRIAIHRYATVYLADLRRWFFHRLPQSGTLSHDQVLYKLSGLILFLRHD